jgi:hypothetical protein
MKEGRWCRKECGVGRKEVKEVVAGRSCRKEGRKDVE